MIKLVVIFDNSVLEMIENSFERRLDHELASM